MNLKSTLIHNLKPTIKDVERLKGWIERRGKGKSSNVLGKLYKREQGNEKRKKVWKPLFQVTQRWS